MNAAQVPISSYFLTCPRLAFSAPRRTRHPRPFLVQPPGCLTSSRANALVLSSGTPPTFGSRPPSSTSLSACPCHCKNTIAPRFLRHPSDTNPPDIGTSLPFNTSARVPPPRSLRPQRINSSLSCVIPAKYTSLALPVGASNVDLSLAAHEIVLIVMRRRLKAHPDDLVDLFSSTHAAFSAPYSCLVNGKCAAKKK